MSKSSDKKNESDNESDAVFGLLVVFAGLGWWLIGGWVGVIVGGIIGGVIGTWASGSSSEDNSTTVNKKNENSINTIEKTTPIVKEEKTTTQPYATRLYAEIVPEIISLCITSDGNIEDEEVNLAINFIESDDLIVDKQASLESLSSNIEQLISERKKSLAIFKLKSTTILHKVKKVSDELQKERLLIVLDGMLDIVKNDESGETKQIVDNIKKNIYFEATNSNTNNLNTEFVQTSNASTSINTTQKGRSVGYSSVSKPNTANSNKRKSNGYSSLIKTGAAVAGGALIGNAVAGGIRGATEEVNELENDIEQDSITDNGENYTSNENDTSEIDDSMIEDNDEIMTSELDVDEDITPDLDDDGGFFDLFND